MAAFAQQLPNQPCVPLGHLWNWPSPAPEPFLVLEAFVDYCCPFSALMFKRLTEEVIPHYNKDFPRIKLIIQQVPQPWHMQSSLMHESVCAVRHLYGINVTNTYQTLLLSRRDEYTDVVCQDETRNQICQRLSDLAAVVEGVESEAVMSRLRIRLIDNERNSGSESTRVLKFYIKQHRQLGIHVTPTCRINGVVIETSSGFTLDNWVALLEPMVQLAESGQA